MEDQTTQNAMELAEAALDPEYYDPFARAEDRGYPTTDITVYWDELAARKLADHELKMRAQTRVIAVFTEAVRQGTEARKGLDKGDPNYKANMTLVQKAIKGDTASLKKAQEDYNVLEEEMVPLQAKVDESAVKIGFLGFDGDVKDSIHESLNKRFPSTDGEPNPDWGKHYSAEVIAHSINWTQRADESEPNYAKIPAQAILAWRKNLPDESYQKIVNTASIVTLATGLFKSLEDAGFLAKS